MNMQASESYRRSSQILLGAESMYPDKELISRSRYVLESLTFHRENSQKVLEDIFVVLKLLKQFPVTPYIEKLAKAEDSKQLFEATLHILEHLTYASIYEDIRLISSHFTLSEDSSSLNKLVLRFLNDLSKKDEFSFCKDLTGIVQETDSFVKVKKILNFYESLYDDDSVSQLTKALEHYMSLDSEGQLLSFLHKTLDIPLFNNIKNLGDFPERNRLIESLSKGQIKSKMWAVQNLKELGLELKSGLVLCGWFGVLPYLMFENGFDRVVSVDIDSKCESIARRLNKWHFDKSRYQAMTADIFGLDYENVEASFKFIENMHLQPDIIINTSCEHIPNFQEWYAKIPNGQLLLLQSNDFFNCAEHVNCINSTAEFRAQAPMAKRLFSGALPLEKYTRYMVIGYK